MSTDKNKLIPELRFPEFEDEGEWEETELGKCLDYLQPTKYLVESTDYRDVYDIPVLTAGKTFILGYTNEKNGIFEKKLPVIIFDDFTTASKYVDFPFKAKSSAMKILFANKNTSIKFVFESLQMIGYEVGVHKRHWISIFSNLKIPIPNPQEQQKIASCLSSLDEVITAHNQKLDTLKAHKKGLMQNLFPTNSITNDELEITNVPKYRFPEFLKDGEWVEKKLGEVFSIFQGFAFSSKDNVSSGTRWLKIADVGIQKMKEDNPTYLPSSFKETYQRFLVRKGDFVMALTRPILNMELKIAPVDNVFHNALLNQRVGKIVTSNNSSFVYYLIQTTKMVGNINKNIAGNEPPNLSFQQIEDIDIFLPKEIKEQQKIASCLSTLDDLITAQTEKIAQLKLHKKGLMQGLFPKSITN